MLSINTTNVVIFNSFNAIEIIWQRFEKTSDNYAFQQFNWLKHWYNTIGLAKNYQLCLTVIECPVGQPIMLLPLGIEQRNNVACLVWLGGKVSDYHAPLLQANITEHMSAEFFQTIWTKVKAQLPTYDAIIFEKMPATIAKQKNPWITLPCIPTASNAHFTHLTESLEHFLKTKRSSKSIATEKRKHRRLQEQGETKFVVAKTPEQISLFLDAMMQQKARSYQEMGVANLFSDQSVLDFFNTLSNDACPTGFVHLSALLLNDRIIASHWGVVYKHRFYHLYPTYEQSELTKYAPGGLLMWHLFDWCMTNNVEIYDFTIGDEPYKDQWCDQELALYDYYQGITLKGICYAEAIKFLHQAKRTIKQTPALWQMAQTVRAKLSKLPK